MNLVSRVLLGLGLSIITTSFSFAADSTDCPDRLERGGSIQVQQGRSAANVCFLSIGNYRTEGGIYRNYLFTGDGELMVFNSYGWGEDSDSTAAREYFFFPRPSTIPSFNWNSQTRQLEVTAASGDQFFFDYEEAQLVSMSKGQVKLADQVGKDNKGGVEISKYQGLLLDGGFKIGSAPTSNRNNSSVFRDAAGVSCTVKNSTIFNYVGAGDVYFKFSDKDLAAFLKRSCAKLSF